MSGGIDRIVEKFLDIRIDVMLFFRFCIEMK